VQKISNNPHGNVLKKLGFMGVRRTFWGLASTEFLLPPNSLVWGLSPQNPLCMIKLKCMKNLIRN